jgi:predicted nucleotidyltransferase
MRLKKSEIDAIKEVTRTIFGEKSTVSLFGSRTNDNKKGGDIDLFIQCNLILSRSELYRLKILFLVRIKEIIGDQKIDVIIDGLQSKKICNVIHEEAIQL